MTPKNQKEENSLISFGSGLSLFFIGLAIVGFLILLLPILSSWYNYSTLGSIGDTVGGLLNPIVGIAAALLTFLAFYVQYIANQKVQRQLRMQQFESQFYEKVRLHKENINEISVHGYELMRETTKTYVDEDAKTDERFKQMTTSESQVARFTRGRQLFERMFIEVTACYELLEWLACKDDNHTCVYDESTLMQVAYRIVYYGINSYNNDVFEGIDDAAYIEKVKKDFNKKRKDHKASSGQLNVFYGRWKEKGNPESKRTIRLYVKYKPFSGHEFHLGHYYRHLFSTVKYVVQQEGDLLHKVEVQEHLKTLRSQLSAAEQIMLYYHFRMDHAAEWETYLKDDYNMIENIPKERLKYIETPEAYFKRSLLHHS
ncbi:putative phage abortive infection protein [Kordia sp. SMS9]|uniref:putative phage abortive infection protein n=1 Tax=Kordia sp. SMS9 TaxID=2282170 RepID=UPI000E0D0551|nr:putative phage abortive infection protein [Kordia sp. SMS9]AXG70813.1 putative phage abortive infection protein [Kordia sp. SMS9]